MKELIYPMRFIPIPKIRIWGGNKLKEIFYKDFSQTKIGESWEISTIENDVSIVSNGILKGKTLQELLEKYKECFLGNKNYKRFGNQFPLLIKFIDAADDLSIQVHPNDELARKRYNSFGKTEMWYVMDVEDNANLILGFNQNLSKERYQEILNEGSIEKYLNYEKVKKGDSFFVEAGLIHAIGKGVMIAEIQQTSDLTYRVYDWNRKDVDGNERELHTDLALDALKYEQTNNCKIIKKESNLVDSEYFIVNKFDVAQNGLIRNLLDIDSFIIYMIVEGDIKLNGNIILRKGETILFPAIYKEEIIFEGDGKVLEIYI
ncbi:mannose-6-phosphate isomerase [Flavobacteriaceae bacterium UJ101]|nr:mannose-6-phosphate isomerase [Flavobacteriaceae bacterium UJ101]